MKAVILAGGMGTRLKSVTGEHPKPMAPFLGRPLMEHIVRLLRENGFDEICCTLRYRAGEIMAHFGDGSRFGVRMEYRIETEALGTAGGVKNCADFFGDEDFLVISGDAACDFPLSRLMEEHRAGAAAATLALCRSALPLRYGLAVTDGAGDIRAFIEKPTWPRVVSDLVNTGIYALSPRALEMVPEGPFDFGRDLFPLLLRRGERLHGTVLWRATGAISARPRPITAAAPTPWTESCVSPPARLLRCGRNRRRRTSRRQGRVPSVTAGTGQRSWGRSRS